MMIPVIGGTQVSQIHRDGEQNGGCQELWEGEMKSYCLMGIAFHFYKMKRVVEINSGDGFTTMRMYCML